MLFRKHRRRRTTMQHTVPVARVTPRPAEMTRAEREVVHYALVAIETACRQVRRLLALPPQGGPPGD